MQPTRGLGSAPLPPANRGCALLFGLAPGRVCRVSLRPRRAGIVTVALVLASRRTGVTRCPALWSSDFPHVRRLPGVRATVRPPRWPADCRRRSGGAAQPDAAAPQARRPPPTDAGPPAATRSMRLVREPVGGEFCARGTCVADQRVNPASVASTPPTAACSFASLTRQRPLELLDDQLRVEEQVDLRRRPSRRASSSARTTPVYSATLFVWMPRASEIVASGRARRVEGVRTASPSISAAPSDAGPGLPRAAPSVRMIRCR